MVAAVPIGVSGGEAIHELDVGAKFELDGMKSLLDSEMWTIAANYYDEENLDAFTSNDVPMFVTSNAKYCQNFAELTFNYMKDRWSAYEGADELFKITVVEIGGGHGRFSYLFLRHFMKYKTLWLAMGMPEAPINFIFTDIAEGNVETLRKHHHFSEFVNAGVMDFGVLDCNTPPGQQDIPIFNLSNSKAGEPTYLPKDQHVVVVANYVFDSLKTDYLQFDPEGRVYRAYCALYSPLQSDLDHPTSGKLIGRMSFKWEWREIPPSDIASTQPSAVDLDIISEAFDAVHVHYCSTKLRGTVAPFMEGSRIPLTEVPSSCDMTDSKSIVIDACHLPLDRSCTEPTSALNLKESPGNDRMKAESPYYLKDREIRMVIEEYIRYATTTGRWLTLTVSVGAIHFMQALQRNRSCLFLVGDKGYSGITDFHTKRKPHIAIHGSLSFMVNMHALKDVNTFLGGQHVSSPFSNNFQILCLIGYQRNGKFSLKKNSNLISKCVDVLTVPPDAPLAHLNNGTANTKCLKDAVETVRSIAHDTDSLEPLSSYVFSNELKGTQTRLEHDLMRDLFLLHDNWYYLTDNDAKTPLSLAFIAMRLGRVYHALRFLSDVPMCQRDAPYFTNIATCHQSLGNLNLAVQFCNKALEVLPNFSSALSIKEACELMDKPLRVAIIGTGPTISANLMHSVFIRDSVKIVAFAGRREDSDTILDLLRSAEEATNTITYYRENTYFDDLMMNEEFDIAIIDTGVDSHEQTKLLFDKGIHVFSGASISVDESEDLVMSYVRNRFKAFKSGRFLNWHHMVGVIPAEVIKSVRKEVPTAQSIMGITIEVNEHCKDIASLDADSLHLRNVSHSIKTCLIRVHEVLSHLGVTLKSFYAVKYTSSAAGHFVLSLGEGDGVNLVQGIVGGSISAVPTHATISIQLMDCNLLLRLDADEHVVVVKTMSLESGHSGDDLDTRHTKTANGRRRVLCSTADRCTEKLGQFIGHYMQESRTAKNSAPLTDDEFRSNANKLSLGIDHALKYRGVAQLIKNHLG